MTVPVAWLVSLYRSPASHTSSVFLSWWPPPRKCWHEAIENCLYIFCMHYTWKIESVSEPAGFHVLTSSWWRPGELGTWQKP